ENKATSQELKRKKQDLIIHAGPRRHGVAQQQQDGHRNGNSAMILARISKLQKMQRNTHLMLLAWKLNAADSPMFCPPSLNKTTRYTPKSGIAGSLDEEHFFRVIQGLIAFVTPSLRSNASISLRVIGRFRFSISLISLSWVEIEERYSSVDLLIRWIASLLKFFLCSAFPSSAVQENGSWSVVALGDPCRVVGVRALGWDIGTEARDPCNEMEEGKEDALYVFRYLEGWDWRMAKVLELQRVLCIQVLLACSSSSKEMAWWLGMVCQGSTFPLLIIFLEFSWSMCLISSLFDMSTTFPEMHFSAFYQTAARQQQQWRLSLIKLCLSFQQQTPTFITDFKESSVMSVCFARFHPNLVVGGTYSGQIVLWDNRSHRRTPVQRTPLSAAAHTVSQAYHTTVPTQAQERKQLIGQQLGGGGQPSIERKYHVSQHKVYSDRIIPRVKSQHLKTITHNLVEEKNDRCEERLLGRPRRQTHAGNEQCGHHNQSVVIIKLSGIVSINVYSLFYVCLSTSIIAWLIEGLLISFHTHHTYVFERCSLPSH
ncbi:cytoplasmic dynein 1 intermediate chain 1, partial [Sigmodon hispidus]